MPRSVFGASRAFRIFTAIFAIVTMLCVSAVSLSAAHTHLKDQADRCDICCAAHLAAGQVAVIEVVHSPELQSLFAPVVTVQRVESRVVLSPFTRGPPVSL